MGQCSRLRRDELEQKVLPMGLEDGAENDMVDVIARNLRIANNIGTGVQK